MAQLSLFDAAKEWVDASRAMPELRPYQQVLCEWTTAYGTRDEDYQPLLFTVTVTCREAVVREQVGRHTKEVPGYVVEVLEVAKDGEGRVIAEGVSYGRSFLQKERGAAIGEYASCVAMVHHQWRAVGESRVRVLQEAGEVGDWYECPFCGYMALVFFETCRGCGKRFMMCSIGDNHT